MRKTLPADFNPVKLMMEMPIDQLERVVAAMEQAESDRRAKKIIARLDRCRQLGAARARKFRKNFKNILPRNAKNGRKDTSPNV